MMKRHPTGTAVVHPTVAGQQPIDVNDQVELARTNLARAVGAVSALDQSARALDLLSEENKRLRQDNIRLAKKLVDAQAPTDGAGVDVHALAERLRKAQDQVRDVLDEQTRLRDRVAELETLNSSMMSMYVAAFQLHSTLDPSEVVSVVEEILVNFIGVSSYAVLLHHDDGDLRVVAQRDTDQFAVDDRLVPRGVIAEALVSQQMFVRTDAHRDDGGVLAVAPIALGRTVNGALVVLGLFAQKPQLSDNDVELLQLLSSHAASAVMSAQLYQRTERKVKTLQSMLQLLQPSDEARSR
jgi:hypothetical protein